MCVSWSIALRWLRLSDSSTLLLVVPPRNWGGIERASVSRCRRHRSGDHDGVTVVHGPSGFTYIGHSADKHRAFIGHSSGDRLLSLHGTSSWVYWWRNVLYFHTLGIQSSELFCCDLWCFQYAACAYKWDEKWARWERHERCMMYDYRHKFMIDV